MSKSAQYCYTSTSNSTGLLLLCEVALGKSHELRAAQVRCLNLASDVICFYETVRFSVLRSM